MKQLPKKTNLTNVQVVMLVFKLEKVYVYIQNQFMKVKNLTIAHIVIIVVQPKVI